MVTVRSFFSRGSGWCVMLIPEVELGRVGGKTYLMLGWLLWEVEIEL